MRLIQSTNMQNENEFFMVNTNFNEVEQLNSLPAMVFPGFFQNILKPD